MNNYFVDTHCHVFKSDYENIDEVLKNASNNHIKYVINNGSNNKFNKEVLDLIEKYPNMYGAIGIHPEDVDDATQEDIKFIEDNLSNEKIVAIGEIGLDYYYTKDNKKEQIKLFETQLALAEKYNLPVIVHSRDATEDTINSLKKFNCKGVIHSFSGSLETARIYIKMGYLLGVNGVITFKNARKSLEALAAVPLDRLVLETDCPYMAPVPFRGKRCDSSMIPYMAEKAAEIKGSSAQEILDITCKIGLKLFEIEK